MILRIPLLLLVASVRIWQTNSAGDNVDVIDPATNKVVLKVNDIEVPHGVTFSPDGKRAYISCEPERTLIAVDTKTGKHLGKRSAQRASEQHINFEGRQAGIRRDQAGAWRGGRHRHRVRCRRSRASR